MLNNEKFTNFMKERQKQQGHPFNIFEFLEAKRDYTQTVEKHIEMSEELYKNNKLIAKLCFNSIIYDLKVFGITEDSGYVLDYFKK